MSNLPLHCFSALQHGKNQELRQSFIAIRGRKDDLELETCAASLRVPCQAGQSRKSLVGGPRVPGCLDADFRLTWEEHVR